MYSMVLYLAVALLWKKQNKKLYAYLETFFLCFLHQFERLSHELDYADFLLLPWILGKSSRQSVVQDKNTVRPDRSSTYSHQYE